PAAGGDRCGPAVVAARTPRARRPASRGRPPVPSRPVGARNAAPLRPGRATAPAVPEDRDTAAHVRCAAAATPQPAPSRRADTADPAPGQPAAPPAPAGTSEDAPRA